MSGCYGSRIWQTKIYQVTFESSLVDVDPIHMVPAPADGAEGAGCAEATIGNTDLDFRAGMGKKSKCFLRTAFLLPF